MLICISDSESTRPDAKFPFKERHNFEFLDVEADEYLIDEAFRCNEFHASDLVDLLDHAYQKEMNVIASCTMGVCRSGAICAVGIHMGFEDPGKYRRPNRLVEKLMMEALR